MFIVEVFVNTSARLPLQQRANKCHVALFHLNSKIRMSYTDQDGHESSVHKSGPGLR